MFVYIVNIGCKINFRRSVELEEAYLFTDTNFLIY